MKRLRDIENVSLVSDSAVRDTVLAFDPLRIAVRLQNWDIDAPTTATELEAEFGIIPEMTTSDVHDHFSACLA